MKLLGRISMLLLAVAVIAGIVYPLVAARPRIRTEDLFPNQRSRYVLHIRREETATIKAVPVFVFQTGVIVAIAFGARKFLGVSLNRRPTK